MGLRVAKHGRKELISATLIAAILCAAVGLLGWGVSRWFWWALVLPVVTWALVVWFFRDPQRKIPPQVGLFVSPADGRITDVTPLGTDGPLGREGVQVGIFMNVFDVHVNRSPCEGRVEKVEHRDGAFLDARDPGASQRNESTTITMTHRHGDQEYPVVMRQIAGLIARRIVTDLTVGQSIGRGERIGMIKFGSRVELLLPRELAGEVRVVVGERVKGGQTILAATDDRTETP